MFENLQIDYNKTINILNISRLAAAIFGKKIMTGNLLVDNYGKNEKIVNTVKGIFYQTVSCLTCLLKIREALNNVFWV